MIPGFALRAAELLESELQSPTTEENGNGTDFQTARLLTLSEKHSSLAYAAARAQSPLRMIRLLLPEDAPSLDARWRRRRYCLLCYREARTKLLHQEMRASSSGEWGTYYRKHLIGRWHLLRIRAAIACYTVGLRLPVREPVRKLGELFDCSW